MLWLMLIKYCFLILLWVSWCCVHSIMITKRLTDYLKHRFKKQFKFYRIFFNLFSIITIIPVLIYTHSIQTNPVFIWDGYLKIVQIILLMIVGYLSFAGTQQYNLKQFLGIAHIQENQIKKNENLSDSLMTENNKINISGIHKIIRHPWYSAAFLLIWAKNMDISGLIVNFIVL